MVSRVYVAVVGLLMVLSLAQPQRVLRCKRNVRCPCGYASGGVTQERFCGPENYLNPECCTERKIPPFIIPLAPRQRRNTRSNNLNGLSDQRGSSLNEVPIGTVDDIQSTRRSNQRVPGGTSLGDDNLMSKLVHSNQGPTKVPQTSSSASTALSQAPGVTSAVNHSHGFNRLVANVTDADLGKIELILSGGNQSNALDHTRATDVKETYSFDPRVVPQVTGVKSADSQTHGFNRPVANDTHADFIKFDPRINAGNESIAFKHAWLVFITFEERTRGSGTPICGGTLISSLFVLTTAHCFFESDGSRRSVKKVDLGRFDLNNNREEHSFSRRARDFFVHPDYNQFIRTQVDDIALILLDAPSINGEGYVLPAYLPSDTEDPFRFDDLWARVAGWGGQGPRETFNSKVRETCMQVKSHCCEHHFQNFVPGKQMCFLGPYYTDICAGDSGSPFVVQGFNGPTVIALVSYGSFECGDNKPTINTAVQYYVPWIRSVLRAREPFYDLNLKRDVSYADITCDEYPCTF